MPRRDQLDFVFLVGATKNMRPCVNVLRDNIGVFADLLAGIVDGSQTVLDWRARVVGYRDWGADDPASSTWLTGNVFTRDAAALREQFAALPLHGGNSSSPQPLLDAMMAVATAGSVDSQATEENSDKWRERKSTPRFVIVFMDAGFHPTMSVPEYEGAGVKDLYNVYDQERIRPYFFATEDPSYELLGSFKGAVRTWGSSGGDGLAALIGDSDGWRRTLEQLVRWIVYPLHIAPDPGRLTEALNRSIERIRRFQ